MILSVIACAVLSIVWLVAAAWTMTPRGEGLGRGIISGAARAFIFASLAALGSWGWGLWCEFALAPGVSAWWSLVLLFIGLVVFWSLLRPEKKILSIVSAGHINGLGASSRWLVGKLATYVAARK